MLVDTFVDVGNLSTLLTSPDHQVLHGRRGTGKTHAFTFLSAWAESQGDVATFIDLRTIGSTGGIYGDSAIPITERGTRLLMDVLGQFHDALTDFALERANQEDMTPALGLLDRLGEAITEVRVVGEHEAKAVEVREADSKSGGDLRATIDTAGPRAEAGLHAGSSGTLKKEVTQSASGNGGAPGPLRSGVEGPSTARRGAARAARLDSPGRVGSDPARPTASAR